MSIITVRQTRDPFRDANIEYIASWKVTLEVNDELNMNNIGVRKPKDELIAIYNGEFFSLRHTTIKKYISETDELILTVITLKDFDAAKDRIVRAEQIKYLKGLFFRAWTRLASPLYPATSGSDESQTNKALPQASPQKLESCFSGLHSSILTCLRRKDGGGYVRLEEDMVEK